jgi:hypothetical protein
VLANNVPPVSELLVQTPSSSSINAMYLPDVKSLTANMKHLFARVCNCAGGDGLDFLGPTATQTASLVTTKLLLNSTISTPDARFSAFNIKNFYYGTPMSR